MNYKKLLPILLLLPFLMIGCEKATNFTDIADPAIVLADQQAINSMDDAYSFAKIYNDSLMNCQDPQLQCHNYEHHFDSMYHHFDSLFTYHHNHYSHNNMMGCDSLYQQHCDSTGQGGGMNGGGMGGGMNGGGMHQSDSTYHCGCHQMMSEMNHQHDPYCLY